MREERDKSIWQCGQAGRDRIEEWVVRCEGRRNRRCLIRLDWCGRSRRLWTGL